MSEVQRALLREELKNAVGRDNVIEEPEEGMAHSLNRNWYTRTLWSEDREVPLPSFVVYPESTEQVSEILQIANSKKIPVTPFGMGSSGMGGNIPVYGGIMVDTKRMDEFLEVNEESLSATVQAGIGSWEYEERLNELGYTSGHLPASQFCSTYGGFLALRSAGRLSTGYGKIEDMVLGLEAVLPTGEVVRTRPVPAHASGPDLNQLFVGSEGAFGIITQATMKIHPYPEERRFRAVIFPDFSSGLHAVRKIMRKDLTPAVARLYTEEETARTFKETWGIEKEGSYLIIGFDGMEELVDKKEKLSLEICEGEGGEDLGGEKGEYWWENRYGDYYPKDKSDTEKWQSLLGGYQAGGTVTTCLPYDKAEDAYKEIRRKFKERFEGRYKNWIHAHFSHWYKSGTMFYVRWYIRGIPEDEDTLAVYNEVWSTLVPIALKYGGVVDHHHGVGRMLARFLEKQDKGSHEVLKKIKGSLDPNNIMNPGVLGLGEG